MGESILVAVDDSPEARRALDQAIDLAARLGARVVLLSVAATALLPRDLLDPAPAQQLAERFRSAAERLLAQFRRTAEAAGVPVETRCVEGAPADEIIAEAGRGYLFVVIGRRGAGLAGRERALLGSVSDRVLRQSPVPVLLVGGGG
jgi:nucleotide-binding universal stress UspA family protein